VEVRLASLPGGSATLVSGVRFACGQTTRLLAGGSSIHRPRPADPASQPSVGPVKIAPWPGVYPGAATLAQSPLLNTLTEFGCTVSAWSEAGNTMSGTAAGWSESRLSSQWAPAARSADSHHESCASPGPAPVVRRTTTCVLAVPVRSTLAPIQTAPGAA